MIEKVTIRNFKSVVDLPLELGRFNVFIGANGCGKSNILEAIAFGGAAAASKLSYEFMAPRGIRVVTYPDSEKMLPAFEKGLADIDIDLFFESDNVSFGYDIWVTDDQGSDENWEGNETEYANKELKLKRNQAEFKDLALFQQLKKDEYLLLSNTKEQKKYLSRFLIYAPENSCLRKFEDEGQILPLGVRGEGLYKHLQYLSTEKPDKLNEIKENLYLLDWFDDVDFDVSSAVWGGRNLKIKDRFLDESHNIFDQRSVNEGFLFLLFYFTLFISDKTPSFFAIDNIDTALNPRLCEELIIRLNELSKKHNKQVILTTHNPAILNGLNINDPEQRLFVISRNPLNGHTVAEHIKEKPNTENEMPLSELWMSGLLGGLPNI